MPLPVGGSEFPVFEMSHGLTVFLACISKPIYKKDQGNVIHVHVYIYRTNSLHE